jgi:hypothetical protein
MSIKPDNSMWALAGYVLLLAALILTCGVC